MKVRTKDFQRLKGENEFEFPVGITVIQGRSGSGKSSVFYAIEDCLTNPSGVADVINWDAKQAEVEIENDGGYAKWIKTASSCEYVDKDGKEYIKASKIDSRDIADLGFYFNPKGNIVNIHGEWSKLFPFEASDTEMFKLFEDIFNISSSFQIVESIKKDEQGFKAQINSINKELNDLTQQNNNLEYVLESLDRDVYKYINNLSIYQNRLKELSEDYNLYQNTLSNKTLNIPNEFDTGIIQSTLNKYNILINDYNTYANSLNMANISLPSEYTLELKENPYIADYNLYSQLLKDIQTYDASLNDCNLRIQTLEEEKAKIKVCPTCGRPLE